MMKKNDLVPVYKTNTGDKVVYGTELHKVLGVKSNYREWIKRRITDCDALKNEDFQGVEISTPSGQNKKDHIIKLDTAKEMAMLERNENGKKVRRYFIEVEKKYKELKNEISRENQLILSIVNASDKTERVQALSEYKQMIEQPLLETIDKQDRQLEIQKPFVKTAIKLQNTDNTVSFEKAAKLISDNGIDIGRNTLMNLLRQHNILMENNSPYERYKKAGCFKVKMAVKENHYGAKLHSEKYVH